MIMRSKGKEPSNKKKNTLVRIIASPIRALGKARDMYVRSITNCGNQISYGVPSEGAGRFSRSHSVATSSTTSHEDYAELLRAASARTLINRLDMDLVLKQQHASNNNNNNNKVLPKSSSVGMSRIEEDKPFDSQEGVAFPTDSYPRSRSYAVGAGIRKPAFETAVHSTNFKN